MKRLFTAMGWTAALALAAVPAMAQAQEDVLSLESAIRLALTSNESALSADQRIVEADARLAKARAAFMPAISLSGSYTRRPFEVRRTIGASEIVVQSYNSVSGSANFSLTLFDSAGIPALRQAQFGRRAEAYGAADSKRRLAFEVGDAYLSTLGVDQVLEASRNRLVFAKQSLDAAKARHAAGLVSVNDVTRAELEYTTAEMGLIQVQGQVESTYLTLGYLLNGPTPRKLRTPEFVAQAVDGKLAPADQLIAQAQARRPDIQSLRWESEGLHALKLAPLLKWLPSFALTGAYRYTNEAGLTGKNFNWNVGVSMSWSVFDGFTRNADFSERKAYAIQADLALGAALRAVERDVRDALVSLESGRAALRLAQVTYDVALKNSAETTELYRQGLSSALEVADANVRLFEANVALVRTRYSLGVAYLNLEAALGLDPLGKEPSVEK